MRARFYPPTSVYELMHSFSPSDLSDSPCVNPTITLNNSGKKDNYLDMYKDMQHIKNGKAVE